MVQPFFSDPRTAKAFQGLGQSVFGTPSLSEMATLARLRQLQDAAPALREQRLAAAEASRASAQKSLAEAATEEFQRQQLQSIEPIAANVMTAPDVQTHLLAGPGGDIGADTGGLGTDPVTTMGQVIRRSVAGGASGPAALAAGRSVVDPRLVSADVIRRMSAIQGDAIPNTSGVTSAEVTAAQAAAQAADVAVARVNQTARENAARITAEIGARTDLDNAEKQRELDRELAELEARTKREIQEIKNRAPMNVTGPTIASFDEQGRPTFSLAPRVALGANETLFNVPTTAGATIAAPTVEGFSVGGGGFGGVTPVEEPVAGPTVGQAAPTGEAVVVARGRETPRGTPRLLSGFDSAGNEIPVTFDPARPEGQRLINARTGQPLADNVTVRGLTTAAPESPTEGLPGLTQRNVADLNANIRTGVRTRQILENVIKVVQNDPMAVSWVGGVRRFGQNVAEAVRQSATAFGGRFEALNRSIQQEIRDKPPAGGGRRVNIGLFSPDLPVLEGLYNALTYQLASIMFGQSGRSVSDLDFQNARAILGGPFDFANSPRNALARLNSALNIVNQEIELSRRQLGGADISAPTPTGGNGGGGSGSRATEVIETTIGPGGRIEVVQ